MKRYFKSSVGLALTFAPLVLAQSDTPPLPAEVNPPGWPLVGFGLAFLLVGGAVFVSMYTSKRSNLE